MQLRRGPFKRERHKWRPREALLFKMKVHTTSKTVNSILDSWQEVSRNLFFDNHLDLLLGNVLIHQILDLMHKEGELQEDKIREIVAYCRTRKLNCVEGFWLGDR